MNAPTFKRGRPARASGTIIEHYRREIVAGQLRAGQRLPSREELAGLHRVSVPTAQRAMTQLEAEGWIVSLGRQGTFVTQRLPHQHRYLLLLPYHPDDTEWFTLFYRALTAAAEQLTRAGEGEFLLAHAHRAALTPTQEEQILTEVKTHRVGGVIFADYPARLTPSRLFREPGLYHVALSFEPSYQGVLAVSLNAASWYDRAVTAAVAAGRRRVACLAANAADSIWGQAYRAALERHGLEHRLYWRQVADPRAPYALPGLLALWRALPAEDRPDALLLTDDNYVEPATRALRDLDVRVPDDLLVIGHFNHPCRPTAHVPVRWLGYDCVALLRRARAVIDAQRRGDGVGTLTALPAVWAEELETVELTKSSVMQPVGRRATRNRLRAQPEGAKT